MSNEINLPIYMDYASTTPVDPRVAQKISDHLTLDGNFGNPASRSHKFGWKAEEAVEEARSHVANLVNCDPREIVWTSGATEADNLAIKGIANFYKNNGKHIITSKIEHKAVLDPCRQLERDGFEITYLEPNDRGLITPKAVSDAIREDTILVSIMHINNELGTINDLHGIGRVARKNSVFFHVDAAQSTGKVDIDLGDLPVDLMSFSAHKTYGPKGIGALFVRRKPRVRIEAQIHGGGHERGMRSGTLPTHQIVGMGEAFKLAKEEMDADKARIKLMHDRFYDSVSKIEEIYVNGDIKSGLGLPNWEKLFAAWNIKAIRLKKDFINNKIFIKHMNQVGPSVFIVPTDPEQTYFPKIQSRVTKSGSMESNPIHIMTPELTSKEMEAFFKYLK